MGDDRGLRFEEWVSALCSRKYFSDFVVRSPHYLKGGRAKREAADLLLVWEDLLVVLQLKSLTSEANAIANPEIAKERLRRGAVKAARQVRAIREALLPSSGLTARTLLGVTIPVTNHGRVLGIVVVARVDSNGLPTETGISPLPVQIEVFDDVLIHVIDGSAFETILDEFDTMPDLLGYLATRGKALRAGIFSDPPAELDFLAMHQAEWPRLQGLILENRSLVRIHPGYWGRLRDWFSHEWAARASRRQQSAVYDDIIERLRDASYRGCDNEGPALSASPECYFRVATTLASVPRINRVDAARRFVEKALLVADGARLCAFFSMEVREAGAWIVFMASRLEVEQRRAALSDVAGAVFARYRPRHVVGVVTEAADHAKRTYDHVLVTDLTNEELARHVAMADQLLGPIRHGRRDEWGNES